MTFFYLEPGVNGACKWKAEAVLRDDPHTLAQKAADGGGSSSSSSSSSSGRQKAEAEAAPHVPTGEPTSIVQPSAQRHSALDAAKRWARDSDVCELIRAWGSRNNARWVISAVAAVASGLGTMVC